MSKPLAVERETIILYNEAGVTADIETHNTAIRRRIEAIRRERQEEITVIWRGGCADSYSFPKKWIKIIPPRRGAAIVIF
jgi:hypothetical protein